MSAARVFVGLGGVAALGAVLIIAASVASRQTPNEPVPVAQTPVVPLVEFDPREVLKLQLQEVTGPHAIACGLITLDSESGDAAVCASRALKGKLPFWVATQVQMDDSEV